MKQTILFYIGNSILKCALVHTGKNEKPKVLLTQSIILEHLEKIGTTDLKDDVIRNLEKLCQEFKQTIMEGTDISKRIDRTLAIVSGPWYVSETKLMRKSHEKPIVIREGTVLEFLENSETEMKNSAGADLISFERKIVNFSLNGYLTGSPLQKKARVIEATVIESFIDKDFAEKAKGLIDLYFPTGNFKFHSLSLASFVALRDSAKTNKDFLIADVTGLISEVSLVRENVIEETISLPIGFNNLIGLLMKDLSISLEVALTILQAYQDERIEKGTAGKTAASFAKFRIQLSDYLSQAFGHLGKGISLPSKCLVICQFPFETLITELIKDEDYSRFSLSQGTFNTEVVTANSFGEFIDWNGNVPDTSIAIASLFSLSLYSNRASSKKAALIA